ncbi:MAG: NAD(P)-dependent alcohol dehydrogenase [Deltaproteobacteria bacterium]|nr:NAD(P)-dependent alcohol dehydrogenase [Deltaproteobacteria bacterium]
MRAWQIASYGDISKLELGQTGLPTVGDDDILVRVLVAALNPADLKVISGKNGGKFLHASRFPLTPGFDFSGYVESVGPQVKHLVRGMEVFGFLPYGTKTKQGSFADYLKIDPNTVAQKATNTPHLQAAASATSASTAYQALRGKGRLQAGQRVLIHGASGGVGSCAVQIAKLLGAEVWGSCSAPSLPFVRGLGVDQAFDYRQTRLRDLAQRFDLVFDVASVSSYSACTSILRRGGTYLTLLPSPSLVSGKLASAFSSHKCKVVVVKPKAADLAQIAQWLENGQLSVPIDATYSFENLPAALARLEDGGVKGKVVVEVATLPAQGRP